MFRNLTVRLPRLTATVLGMSLVAVAAFASVTLNPDGTGFVGKGDVQLVYGWNNKQLQDNAGSIHFRVNSVSQTTWECKNSNNEHIQQRHCTTTTQGLVSCTAREKTQITGFNLTGYVGAPTTSTQGPVLNSCPSGPWSYVEGSTQTTSSGDSMLEVSCDGTNWSPL
jgi:hypothetical protein